MERQKYEVSDLKLHDNIINLKEEQLTLKNIGSKIENEIKLNQLEFDTINDKGQKIEREINNINDHKRKLEIELANKLREKQYLQNNIEYLKDKIEHNSSLPTAVVKVLNSPKLRGIHNALGNVIEVEEQYSLAITTALGQSLSNVITDNEFNAKEAILYLKTNQLGRATFFPLNIIKPRGIDNVTLSDLNNLVYLGVLGNSAHQAKKEIKLKKNKHQTFIVVYYKNLDKPKKYFVYDIDPNEKPENMDKVILKRVTTKVLNIKNSI